MKYFFVFLSLTLCLFSFSIFSLEKESSADALVRDLKTICTWVNKERFPLPIYYNHLLQAGYINMPSARMHEDGNVAVGSSWVPPYHNYNINLQIFKNVEFSGNYRIFRGITDPILSPTGFGDRSDKGANVKLNLLLPEDSNYVLPGIAFGLEDFLGSKLFESQYIAMTKVWPQYNFEATLGFGSKRLKGLFGGLAWFPCLQSSLSYLKHLALIAEYDATQYERKEPHPDGRLQKNPINYGIAYRLANYWDLSVSHIRGKEIAGSFNVHYNFGQTKGFLPKIKDSLPYNSPINTQQLGVLRSKDQFAQDFVFAFKEQGFTIYSMILSPLEGQQKSLWIKLKNNKYRKEREAHHRISSLLKALTPSDLSKVTISVESEGIPCHQYEYRREDLECLLKKKISSYEMAVITPIKEFSPPPSNPKELIYHKNKSWGDFFIRPRMRTIFGSAQGKFKYDFGVASGIEGYPFNRFFYRCELGYTLTSSMENAGDKDRLNPSQVINVQSDYIRYRQENSFTIEQLFLQKSWNMGKGWYSRFAAGHFQAAYGGIAGEILFSPINSNWSIGTEAAIIKKREYSGIKFKKNVRKLIGFTPTFEKYTGKQYFLDFYYDIPNANIDLKLSAGQFLAFDKGVRTELSRYFPNGLKIMLWYTLTNANDRLNGERYFDKGIAFTMPIELFYKYSSRTEWGYGMSAWLRDVGARSKTGKSLYPTIKSERR